MAKSIIAHPAQELQTRIEEHKAVEHALAWFEQWDRHADHSNDFGGEQECIKRLRFALREVYLRDEL
jgi:hypothetical protein